MRNSLLFKLLGAFLLVVAASALVIAWLTSRVTRQAFSLYTTRSGQAWALRLAPTLEAYYAENGGWQGVEALLESDLTGVEMMDEGMGQMHGRGQGAGMGPGRQTGMWAMMGQRLVLADALGSVISDSGGALTGQTLTAADLELGEPLEVSGARAGTLLVIPEDLSSANTPAAQFLSSVNRSIAASVAIAGVVALALGALLFFQIMSPLRRLNRAVDAIARGDLSQRVEVQSQDELGRLSQAFNQMADNLESAQAQRQRLVADVAHELRTPITVIQANLEALLDGVLPLEAEQVAALHDETLLLNRLVDDLRLLSQAEAGELKLQKQKTDLAGLVGRLEERFKVQCQENAVSLELEWPASLPELWIDADRITQVLNNLVGNALRYTPAGGAIRVEARRMGAAVRVAVRDSGSGIPQADLPYVFERFYRADPSRARHSGGSGLGLAIVRQLVEAHGGAVEANSPVFKDDTGKGYGTDVAFTLPVDARDYQRRF
jgi:two-component system, OmpR family, sensor kinase